MAEWANIQYDGESVGTLYTDAGKFGFVPVVQSSGGVTGFAVVTNLIKAALIASEITAEDSYFGILGSLDKREGFSYEAESGELVKPEPDITALVQRSVDDAPSPYYVRLNEDDEVVNLVQNTGTGILIREGGDWVEPTEENYPEADDYFLAYVSEDSIATYDRIVTENEVPVVDDLEVISSDD